MENGGERRATRWLPKELVMCSTCSGFVFKFKRTAINPNPQEEEVIDVTEAEKMRDLMKAVLLHGPLQEMEPAEATKKQWQVLRRRRRIMVETKRCPTCSGSLLEMCPTCSRSLLEKPGPDEEAKAMVADPRSKEKKKCSGGSEFMAILPSQGGKERKKRKKIVTEEEAVVADARSEQKSKRSREEFKRSSSGLKGGSGSKKNPGSKEKKSSREEEGSEFMSVLPSQGGKERKKIATEDEAMVADAVSDLKSKRSREEGERSSSGMKGASGSKKKAKRLSEMQGRDSESAGGNRKTKMVTRRLDKKHVEIVINLPPPQLPTSLIDYMNQNARIVAFDAVDRVFHEYLQCQSFIKGYAEYQVEVTDDEDDEDDDHRLV